MIQIITNILLCYLYLSSFLSKPFKPNEPPNDPNPCPGRLVSKPTAVFAHVPRRAPQDAPVAVEAPHGVVVGVHLNLSQVTFGFF